MKTKLTIAILTAAALTACVIEPPQGDVEFNESTALITPQPGANVSSVPSPTAVVSPSPTGTPSVSVPPVVISPMPEPNVGEPPVYSSNDVYGVYLIGNSASGAKVLFVNSETNDLRTAAEINEKILSSAVSPVNGDISLITASSTFIQLDRDFTLDHHGSLVGFDGESGLPVSWSQANIGLIYPSNAEGVPGLSHYSTNLDSIALLSQGNAVEHYTVNESGSELVFVDANGVARRVANLTSSPKTTVVLNESAVTKGQVNEVSWCGNHVIATFDFVPSQSDGIQRRLVKLIDGGELTYIAKPSDDVLKGRVVKELQCVGSNVTFSTNYNTELQNNARYLSFAVETIDTPSGGYTPQKFETYVNFDKLNVLSVDHVFVANAYTSTGLIPLHAIFDARSKARIGEFSSSVNDIIHHTPNWSIGVADASVEALVYGNAAYQSIAVINENAQEAIVAESVTGDTIAVLLSRVGSIVLVSKSGDQTVVDPNLNAVDEMYWVGDALLTLINYPTEQSSGEISLIGVDGTIKQTIELPAGSQWVATQPQLVK